MNFAGRRLLAFRIRIAAAVFLTAAAVFSFPPQTADGVPPRYRAWLEEDVEAIITPVEGEVFSKLKSDRERDLFVEAFWKHRDPTPGTEENEFRVEHERRLRYADRYFGRGAPIPGRRTARGRMYIILGQPNDIQRFEGRTDVYPTEVWFYQGLTEAGLPAGFHLLFVQKGGIGDYELYSPLGDGPQALLTSHFGDPVDYLGAYGRLREIDPFLAEVAMNLIPGEQDAASGRPSMASDLLLQKVESSPQKWVKDAYARKFLDYKDIVEVEYSANYIASDAILQVLWDPSGQGFVHYQVEPERLSVRQAGDRYVTELKINGAVTGTDGGLIYQFERKATMEFSSQQLESIMNRPVSIRDLFPLIPGRFRVSILVKNEVSKEFTSVEEEVSVPDLSRGLALSSLVLGYEDERQTPEGGRIRPFQVGSHKLSVQAGRVFLKQDFVTAAFQVHGLDGDLIDRGTIRFSLTKDEEEFRQWEKRVGEFPDIPDFVETWALDDFPPAHYRLEAGLLLDGQTLASTSQRFDITPVSRLPRPWVYSKLLPGTDDPAYLSITGIQLANAGRLDQAQACLEEAYRRQPGDPQLAVHLARVYSARGKNPEAAALLEPLLDASPPPAYEAVLLLAQSLMETGEWARAQDVLEKCVTMFGVNPDLLNRLGRCQFRLGRPWEALESWERSLQLDSDQPLIRRSVELLKESKK